MILKDIKVNNPYLNLSKEERYEYNRTLFDRFVSDTNIYSAHKHVSKGKNRYRTDTLDFNCFLYSNLATLKFDIIRGSYVMDEYIKFVSRDKKNRVIEAPRIRDKIVQRMLFNTLIDVYEPKFIATSYACIRGRGTQRAILKIQEYMKEANVKYKDPYIVKLDISKFYHSIDRNILKNILSKTLYDDRMIGFLHTMLDNYKGERGLPLGNISSQVLSNVYMNVYDQYVKRELKIKYYVRYADDMFMIVDGKEQAMEIKNKAIRYLKEKLNLKVCYNKVNIVKNIATDALGCKITLKGIYLSRRSKTKFKQYMKRRYNAAVSLNSWYGAKGLAKCYGFINKHLTNKNIRFIDDKFIAA